MKQLLIFCLLWCLPAWAQEVPRELVAFYDSTQDASPRSTLTHRFLEMPANHLGWTLRYVDANGDYPPVEAGMRGVVMWFAPGVESRALPRLLGWLEQASKAGKRVLVLENIGVGDAGRRQPQTMQAVNRVLNRLGVQDNNSWHGLTYQGVVESADALVGYERPLGAVLPPFGNVRRVDAKAESHLRLSLKGLEQPPSDLVVTGPHGGFVAPGYALRRVEGSEGGFQWFVDPFALLERSFGAPDGPIPDVTTMNGRRLFFAQVDGDGWNNLSEIPRYQRARALSAEVLRKEILAAHPELPFTVSPIGAELDKDCYGLDSSESVARAIFALPNVEAASHSYSHPQFWRFFTHYTAAREQPFAARYPARPVRDGGLWQSWLSKGKVWLKNGLRPARDARKEALPASIASPLDAIGANDLSDAQVFAKQYTTPRSYACTPFDLRQEIPGAAARLNALLPVGKQVALFTWTGDTGPYPEALQAVREVGLLNLGGGPAWPVGDYASYTAVAPVGLALGSERQIYAANADEQSFADAQLPRFGPKSLLDRLDFSETPLRLLPAALYLHAQAGQQESSLNAVKDMLQSLARRELLPIFAGDYAKLANGFYTAKFVSLGPQRWRVAERGALNTLRFDRASRNRVDFAASSGVIGQRYYQGSLYVALDSAVREPVVALMEQGLTGRLPEAPWPYLVQASWLVREVTADGLSFTTQGFGKGKLQWHMPKPGRYAFHAESDGQKTVSEVVDTGADGTIVLAFNRDAAGKAWRVALKPMS